MAYNYTTRNGQRVQVNVASAFDRLAAAFKARFGLDLLVSSGTRTRAEQQRLYNLYRARKGNLAAAPGTSNHEEGGPRGPRALDVRDSGGDAGVTRRNNARSNWLKANAPAYGFDPAGYRFSQVEPWHIEYTGSLDAPAVSGNQVTKDRQGWLNAARGEKLSVDGVEGPATKAAYKRYQSFLGVAQDGVWGPGTQAAHQRYYDSRNAPAPTQGALTYANIQRGLNKFGYGLVVDGKWGPRSSNALADFQRKRGLTVDRIVGPKTRAALGI